MIGAYEYKHTCVCVCVCVCVCQYISFACMWGRACMSGGRQTGWLADRQTGWHTDRQAGIQTDRLAYRQTKTGRQTNRQTDLF